MMRVMSCWCSGATMVGTQESEEEDEDYEKVDEREEVRIRSEG